jgi:hypothetical protein
MDRYGQDVEEQIAALIREEFDLAKQEARVPPAELVWLRAEMRARDEAARRAVRPIVIGQAIGIAALAGLLVALLSRITLSQLPQVPMALVEAVIGSWLVLAPVALYLALARDN